MKHVSNADWTTNGSAVKDCELALRGQALAESIGTLTTDMVATHSPQCQSHDAGPLLNSDQHGPWSVAIAAITAGTVLLGGNPLA